VFSATHVLNSSAHGRHPHDGGPNVSNPRGHEFSAASSFDPDNATLSYLWDFGDGKHLHREVRQHTLRRPATTSAPTVTELLQPRDNETLSSTSNECLRQLFLGHCHRHRGGLFVLFVLWPVWSREENGRRAQPRFPSRQRKANHRGAPLPRREATKTRRGPAKRGPAYRRRGQSRGRKLDRDFENEVKGQPPDEPTLAKAWGPPRFCDEKSRIFHVKMWVCPALLKVYSGACHLETGCTLGNAFFSGG